jgi:hypothetical protein
MRIRYRSLSLRKSGDRISLSLRKSGDHISLSLRERAGVRALGVSGIRLPPRSRGG